MIDWHSHVLPGVDDGSRDLTESLAMLSSLASQGVSFVVATPHFIANNESVDDFLERRNNASALLSEKITDGMPGVILGAEVKYYSGISHMAELEKLLFEE